MNICKAQLVMKNFSSSELENYLSKIDDENPYAYNVYQIEGEGKIIFIFQVTEIQ